MKLTLKHALAAILLMLSLATPVVAGPFQDAVAAYGRGDYATALRLFQPLADKGDTAAQMNLGVMYANGQGGRQDYAEAVKWYGLAADQGYAPAQLNLALMYTNGQGVPQNYVLAYKWLSLSAAQGNREAVKGRDFIEPLMTPAQIAEAQKLVSAQTTDKPAEPPNSAQAPTTSTAQPSFDRNQWDNRRKEIDIKKAECAEFPDDNANGFIRSMCLLKGLAYARQLKAERLRQQQLDMKYSCLSMSRSVGTYSNCPPVMDEKECDDFYRKRNECIKSGWWIDNSYNRKYVNPYR